MTKKTVDQDARREFIKALAYVTPVVVTLQAAPAFARNGSNDSGGSNGSNGSNGREDGPKDREDGSNDRDDRRRTPDRDHREKPPNS